MDYRTIGPAEGSASKLTRGLEAEALPTGGGLGHQAALDVGEDGNPVAEAGVLGGAGLDGDGRDLCGEGVFTRDELIEGRLVLEDDDLGKRLATDLGADRRLGDVGVADELGLFEYFAVAVGAAMVMIVMMVVMK